MPRRLVAIGDIHGDLEAIRRALRLAQAIDANDHWVGKDTVVVQLGDLLDRGDDEPEVLSLVERLEREAKAAGGAFIAIQGNHEIMNVAGDFRYVTKEGFLDFDAYSQQASPIIRFRYPRHAWGRATAFAPGSMIARALAKRPVVIIVGDTLFVHGGLLPEFASIGLDAINESARRFELGEIPLPSILSTDTSPLWDRSYALDNESRACERLHKTLEMLRVERMVIGHTVQNAGITSRCKERLYLIDVGLSRFYGGSLEVLEIKGPYLAAEPQRGVRVLRHVSAD
ncbi:MAG: metallophosphoesterase [Sandaracinaceae bacterium]|nr:metallophosphoesterase [Sandaracinaceae bacterium]